MSKVAFVVGAGGVLGGALVSEFSTTGYGVAGLHRASGFIGGEPLRTAVDLSDPPSVRNAVEHVCEVLGPIDVLVCNAGTLMMKPFAEHALEDFDLLWRVNVTSACAAAGAVLPGMVRRGEGCILFSGATASIRGSARFPAFAATKFAVRGLAQSLAREYQPQGIHVVHVLIDGVLRGSPSAGRFGVEDERAIDPAEAAKAYRWLAEQPASAWTQELDLRSRREKF